jgi:Domain of unknown function (DUF5004)
MKKIKLSILAATLLLASCKPDVKGELGDPSDKVAGLNGTWEVSAFAQQDPNNPIKEERDLSEFYVQEGLTPYRLTFNSSDKSYSVTNGPGKNFFGVSGTWAYDNDANPTTLYLYNVADTLTLEMGNMVRTWDTHLKINLSSMCVDASGNPTPISIYKFTLNRVNP